jgi:hypothetical protein
MLICAPPGLKQCEVPSCSLDIKILPLKDNPMLLQVLSLVYRFLDRFDFPLDTLPFFFGMVVLLVSVVIGSKQGNPVFFQTQ